MKCKHERKNGVCGLKGCYAYRHKCYTEDCCKCFEPITNADRIRAMSDEELAEFIDGIERSTVEMWHGFCDICEAKECWRRTLEWLKQAVIP